MKIVALGTKPSDLEIGCLRTLMKYSADGHDVSLLIAGNPARWKEKTLANEELEKIGKVYFTDRLDESTVTQEQVNIFRSIITKTKPSLVILPFDKTSDKKRKALAHSALLACRGIKNILMYETTKNKNFSPNIFFTFEKGPLVGVTEYMKLQINSSTKRMRKSVQKFNSRNIKIKKTTEAFESQRVLLLDVSEIA
jgi:LmbE family N-acetylglucosaminyl deacetylase